MNEPIRGKIIGLEFGGDDCDHSTMMIAYDQTHRVGNAPVVVVPEEQYDRMQARINELESDVDALDLMDAERNSGVVGECPECGKMRAEVNTITAERDGARKALKLLQGRMQSILLADKTPQYEYGDPNGVQECPPKGECWLTPSEIAKRSIAYIQKALAGGEDAPQ